MKNKSMKHWIVMLTLCGITISAIGLPVMTNGVFITPIADSLGVYRGSVAMHNTLTLFMKAIMSLYAGILIKKYPFKLVILFGVLLAGISNILLGFANSILIFNILGIVRGIGSGLLAWVPVTIVVNEWFEEKHGLVMSIVLSFSSVTGAVFSPIFTNLIDTIGWEQSYQIMGLLIIAFTIPAIVIPYTLDPRDSGYLPYGYVEVDEETVNKKGRTIKREDQRGVSGLLFGLMFAFTLLQTMLIGVPQHFPGFAQTVNLTSGVGATMLSLAMISSIGFKLGMGYISDFVGPIKSTLSMIFLVAVASLLFIFFHTEGTLYASSLLYGAVFSIPSVSVTLLTKEFFGRYHFVRLYPILAFATSLGGALSISLVGYIFDFTGSYIPAFIFSLAVNLVNFGILWGMVRLYKNK
ncbi:MFS transporter [Alkalibacterium olivapovliticus]|uniref:Putative MFS family arabinose efflux permease n=1 Tax=Alkalibacterium olivapovliticus TaxID=99907 RepID=A0A2T0W7H7_9LACT|nr:MFS transporter [Alkalibacterium olivapovliticus]PRY82474.1 putative MFS family arabinose efflux permease [Alkalibacterium olivapovliticus]